jgi:histidyl-tRNA synthetase
MAKVTVPRGTRDVLPAEWRARHRVLDAARRRFEAAGYGRIMTPTFEHTEVFARGAGETSDIVTKEMYTFADRSDRSLTLRPEGTAGVVRAYIEHGMHREPQPVKLWYFAPMFRYEKPQEGRYREHWQIGAEAFGSEHPAVDAELIALLAGLYREIRVPNVRLRLNSIGDAESRRDYREVLVSYLRSHEAELDDDTRARIDTNPLRAFDSKVARTRELMADAPKITDHLDAGSREHFDALRGLLDAAGVAYDVDPTLVRGLDYYTRTVFEFTCSDLGAQDAVGGGGRYDELVGTLGGPATPAVGFGCGIERLLLAMAAGGVDGDTRGATVDAYVCVEDETERAAAFVLVEQLRAAGLAVQQDLAGRSMKGQLKQAAKLGTHAAIVASAGGWTLHTLRRREEQPFDPAAANAVATVTAIARPQD